MVDYFQIQNDSNSFDGYTKMSGSLNMTTYAFDHPGFHGWGEPHISSFDGNGFDMHGLGEYILARTTVPGDDFEVQARTSPSLRLPVTVFTQVAVKLGSHRVTFDLNHAGGVLWVDGAPPVPPLSSANPTLELLGGTVELLSDGSYHVIDDGGRLVHVYSAGYFLGVDIYAGPVTDGTLEGIGGNCDGNPLNDFALPDGTVVASPTAITYEQIVNVFADAWRVTDANSLLDYAAGQSTATFTNRDFPNDPVSLTDLPPDVVAQAEALVDAAGITDPYLREAAIFDFALTGDRSLITSSLNLQQAGSVTLNNVAPPPPPLAAGVGVVAMPAVVPETDAGTTEAGFKVYRIGDSSSELTVSYTLVAAGAGFAAASDFGGTLPTGEVVIEAGSGSATFSIALPNDFTAPTQTVRIEISVPSGPPVIAPTADVTVTNDEASPGLAAEPAFVLLGTGGALISAGSSWTLDLGTIVQGTLVPPLRVAVSNAAPYPANLLGGMFELFGSGFTVSGVTPFSSVAPGGITEAFEIEVDTSAAGVNTQTVTLHYSESNESGFAQASGDIVLTITDTIVAPSSSGGGGGGGPTTGNAADATPGADNLLGTEGPDTIQALAGNDTVKGLGGNDLISGQQGDDTIASNLGNDTLYGGQGNDRIYGGQDADLMFGNLGNDLMSGNLGNDVVNGGQGNDTLYGGQGDDTLTGGLGNDILFGNLGADRLVFGSNSGADRVNGFNQSAGDRLDLQGQTYIVGSSDNDAILTLSGGGTLFVAGIGAGAITASFFA